MPRQDVFSLSGSGGAAAFWVIVCVCAYLAQRWAGGPGVALLAVPVAEAGGNDEWFFSLRELPAFLCAG